MLADLRRGRRRTGRRAAELRRRLGLAHAADAGMVVLGDQAAGHHLLVGHHLAAAQDRGARHVGLVEARQPVGRGALGENVAHQGDALGSVGGARGRRVEALVVGQRRLLDGAAEALPFGVRDRAGGHVAVERLEDQVGPRLGVVRRGLLSDHRVLHHRFRPEIGDHDVEHRHLDVLAHARLFPRVQRRCDRLGGENRGGLVGHDGPDHLRAPGLRIGLHVGEARKALDDGIVDALLGVGPAVAGAADRDVDQARIERAHGRFAEAQPIHHLRPEILHQHVGAGDQLAQDVDALGLLEVDRQRALAAVGRYEQGGELAGRIDRLAAAARDVAARRLDLDHVGALVGQEHRGERPRHHAGEVDDPHPRQRTCHAPPPVSFQHVYRRTGGLTTSSKS